MPQLKSLHNKFNVPCGYLLTAPTSSEAVYNHGANRAPLYVRHLEFGLRLPLHPFLSHVFTALGISPVQMKPNAIATLVGFVVICHWLAIKPSLKVLGHLVSVKANQGEPHFHFQVVGKYKIITGLPESNKDWKEKFVWVTGDDLELGCLAWPEIRKKALLAGDLSAAEREALDQIRACVGSCKMEDFLDNSVLRVARISVKAPTTKDQERAAKLLLGEETTGTSTAPPGGLQEGPSAGPFKRPLQDSGPRETVAAATQAIEAVGRTEGQPPSAALADRRRKRLRKVGGQGPGVATGATETEAIQVESSPRGGDGARTESRARDEAAPVESIHR